MDICPITTIVTIANTLIWCIIKCNCTTFGLHISMERQRGSLPMSQSTMDDNDWHIAMCCYYIVMQCGGLLRFAYICKIWWCGVTVLGLFSPKLRIIFVYCGSFQKPPSIVYVMGISRDNLVTPLSVICCYYVIFSFGGLHLPNLPVLVWVTLKATPAPMIWQFSMIQSKFDKGYQEISCPKRSFCVKAYKCIKYYSLHPAVAKRIWNP